MKKICVLLDDKIINIGDWEYQKEIALNEDGSVYEKITNPLPDNAIKKELECKQNSDGSWVAIGYEPIAEISLEVVVKENNSLKTENTELKKRIDAVEKSVLGLMKIKIL